MRRTLFTLIALVVLCLGISKPAKAAVIGINDFTPDSNIDLRCEFFDGGLNASGSPISCTYPPYALTVSDGTTLTLQGWWNPCPGFTLCMPGAYNPSWGERVKFVEGPGSPDISDIFEWSVVRDGNYFRLDASFISDTGTPLSDPGPFTLVFEEVLGSVYEVSLPGVAGGPGLVMAVSSDVEGPPLVPEPATAILLASGLVGVWRVSRKRRAAVAPAGERSRD